MMMPEADKKWDFEDDSDRCSAIKSEAEYRAREAEAGPNSQARIAEADAEARAREAEAKYGWIKDAQRFIRTAVLGAALIASFYYTPDLWPRVVTVMSEIIHTILNHK